MGSLAKDLARDALSDPVRILEREEQRLEALRSINDNLVRIVELLEMATGEPSKCEK